MLRVCVVMLQEVLPFVTLDETVVGCLCFPCHGHPTVLVVRERGQ